MLNYIYGVSFFAVASSPESAKNRDDTFVLTDSAVTTTVPHDYVQGSSAANSPTATDAQLLDSPHQPPNGQEQSEYTIENNAFCNPFDFFYSIDFGVFAKRHKPSSAGNHKEK